MTGAGKKSGRTGPGGGDASLDNTRLVKFLLPFAVFAALVVLFMVGLRSGDPSKLPSALIGKPVPEFTLPPLEGLKRDGKQVPGFSKADFTGDGIKILNVWASWCVPCVQEHPFLIKLARQSGAPVFGLNQKDKTASALRFLARLGNPFVAVGADNSGRTAIEWGVYGVPETFIVSRGVIVHKYVGPIDDAVIAENLMPAIEAARAQRR
jgi:cytochrome c biogenesis protein CcmG/thiol:disulfide interchange protein DsbE